MYLLIPQSDYLTSLTCSSIIIIIIIIIIRTGTAGSSGTLVSFCPTTKGPHTPNLAYRPRHKLHRENLKPQTSYTVLVRRLIYFFQINSYCRPNCTGQKTSTTLNLFMLSAAANRMANQLPLKRKWKTNLAHVLYQYRHASLNIFLSNMNTICLSCCFRMTHVLAPTYERYSTVPLLCISL